MSQLSIFDIDPAELIAEAEAIMSTSTINPVEFDTALAETYGRLAKAQARVESDENMLRHAAGAKFHYRGRTRVTDMQVSEARQIVEDALAAGTKLLRGSTLQYFGQPTCIENYDAHLAERAAIRAEIAEANERYTGWSRFFLVTSSAGHIHRDMCCPTCRPTTTYGWLPELSGLTEEDAVAAHGPALCSVCYPSAPVDWQGGKITKAQAEKKAH